ncbi:alpha/beta hydrolase family protein [Alteromonas gracilis]|uniref:S9 family peptidase n=1 Tax=Alteromonas gracilis TaxID=1479524 RepID=A0ABX5CIX0_9ALTE|nr:alpha/beta fold hydrolase [Alteromonas gracilis]PRO67412.1 S9 family peptidase [Alteromonas gracilis]
MSYKKTQLSISLFAAILLALPLSLIGAEPSEGESAYEAFSSLPTYWTPSLSPDGTKIAFVQNVEQEEAFAMLATFDLEKGEKHYLLRSDNERVKINWYNWVNNERLVVSARYETRRGTTKVHDTRLLSIKFDGEGGAFNMVEWERIKRRAGNPTHIPQFHDDVIDWLPDDPDHVLIALDAEVLGLPSVYKVNVNNGSVSRIIRGKKRIRDWLTDQQSNVRIGISLDYDTGEREVFLKEGDDWRTLFAYNAMTEKGEYPVGFAKDPNILYFKGYKDDYRALYTLNLKTNERTEVFADDGYDVDGGLIYSPVTRDAIGVRHDGRFYWDERYVGLQNGIDKGLPDYDNTLVSFSDDEQRYIVYSESDVLPGVYLLGDRKKGKLDVLFQQYSQIDSTKLSEHTLIEYEARDGVKIEAYLTLPKGEGPFPTIIHPHGGPGARDFSGFDYWTAYFTSKGYAVLRPNFRGSRGYGYSFAQSQMKGWGLAMQDDITDAANWMVKQGHAEQDNMCIVGASYGGYAALMATVKTPDLFKCAVSFAGVSSLKHVIIHSRRFLNNEFVKNQIGDDFDDLEARSPYYNAEGIKTPILLVHGEEDRIVPPLHSRYMADQLEDYDKVFKYVELESGDHHLSIQRNRHLFFKEMDMFLDQYLKPVSKDNGVKAGVTVE